MKIGFDFDRVLFKTDRFKQHLFNQFEKFDETYSEAVEDGVYSPERHAEVMGVNVEEIYEELKHASEFLYDDIEKLEQLKPEFNLVIVSRGDPVLQEKKIEESGVLKTIPEHHIVQEKPKDEAADIDFLVDDSEEEIQRVDVPSLHFNRDKHSIKDVIEKIDELRSEKSDEA